VSLLRASYSTSSASGSRSTLGSTRTSKGVGSVTLGDYSGRSSTFEIDYFFIRSDVPDYYANVCFERGDYF
jgi:BRCT domain type II-containing protein